MRQRLPKENRGLAQECYQIEAKLNADLPEQSFPTDELVQLKVMGPDGMWLYQTVVAVPLYAAGPSFEGQQIVVAQSYRNPAVRLQFDLQGIRPRV